ncbi:hypothetical protein PLESTF_000021100 [Pleodorina starrii]|nr:hypothetical protein PLESTF_000021100 [Pleodorina starrii]
MSLPNLNSTGTPDQTLNQTQISHGAGTPAASGLAAALAAAARHGVGVPVSTGPNPAAAVSHGQLQYANSLFGLHGAPGLSAAPGHALATPQGNVAGSGLGLQCGAGIHSPSHIFASYHQAAQQGAPSAHQQAVQQPQGQLNPQAVQALQALHTQVLLQQLAAQARASATQTAATQADAARAMAAAKPSLHPGTAAAVAAQAEGTAKQKRERQQRKSQSGAASSGSCGASGGSTGRKSQKAQPSASAGAGSIDVNDDAESAGGSDRGASRGWADREMLVMLHVYEAQLKAEAISFRQNTLNGNNMNWDAIALRTAELSGLLARSGNACKSMYDTLLKSARVVLAYQKKSTGNGAPWWQLSEDDRKNWADPRGFKDYKLISEKVFEEVCRVGKHNNAVEPVDVTTVGGFGLKVATSSQKGAGDSNAQGAVSTVSAGGGVDAVDLTAEKEEVTKKPRGGSAASSNQDSDSEDKEVRKMKALAAAFIRPMMDLNHSMMGFLFQAATEIGNTGALLKQRLCPVPPPPLVYSRWPRCLLLTAGRSFLHGRRQRQRRPRRSTCTQHLLRTLPRRWEAKCRSRSRRRRQRQQRPRRSTCTQHLLRTLPRRWEAKCRSRRRQEATLPSTCLAHHRTPRTLCWMTTCNPLSHHHIRRPLNSRMRMRRRSTDG